MSKKELEKFWKKLEEQGGEERLRFKEVEIQFCCQSPHVFANNMWVKYDDADAAIIDEVKKKIVNPDHIPLEIHPVHDELQMKPGLSEEIQVEVSTPNGVYDIPVKLSYTICPKVSKMGTEYYEGILQLRGSQKLIDRAGQLIHEFGAFINKETRQKEGVDWYVTDIRAIRKTFKALTKEFVGEHSESPQIFSLNKQTGKDIIRLNCFFKEMPWKIGDVVDLGGEKVKITTIGKRVTGKLISSGKKVFVH